MLKPRLCEVHAEDGLSLTRTTSTELYLVDLVPLGVQVLLDGLALETPVADSDCCVGV